MRSSISWLARLLLAYLPLAYSEPVNILISNDDGWAESNIRHLWSHLDDAGFHAIISAPATDQSGTHSRYAEPDYVGRHGCEFMSCPAGSQPTGSNASMPEFNYVNSYPASSMRYGLGTLSSQFFNGLPDLAVAGVNVGHNRGFWVFVSGTVGAVVEAGNQGIPAIAFSGATGKPTAWNATAEPYMDFYASLSTMVVQALTRSGKPYLDPKIWLNVNFPPWHPTECSDPSQVKFVLSRIFPRIPFWSLDDVNTCNNNNHLPTEHKVRHTPGCFASISAGRAPSKLDAHANDQSNVLVTLADFLSCLPPS